MAPKPDPFALPSTGSKQGFDRSLDWIRDHFFGGNTPSEWRSYVRDKYDEAAFRG